MFTAPSGVAWQAQVSFPANEGSAVCRTVLAATTRANFFGALANAPSPMGPPQSWTTRVMPESDRASRRSSSQRVWARTE